MQTMVDMWELLNAHRDRGLTSSIFETEDKPLFNVRRCGLSD